MWVNRAVNRVLLAALLSSAWPGLARADEPPSQPPADPSDDRAGSLQIEPPVYRPPWSGREAIWGGVGLIIAGVATVIVVAPALCTSSLFGSGGGVAGATTTTDSRSTCVGATLGGGAGGAALGAILLAVGESQRATYKTWLRAHPMFGGLSVEAGPRGPGVGWGVSF
jgi:hypothetical protein